MPNYAKMDIEELEERATALDEKIVDASNAMDKAYAKERGKVMKLQGEYNELMAVLNMKRRLGNLSPDDVAALSQVVKAQGIESAEAVNGQ